MEPTDRGTEAREPEPAAELISPDAGPIQAAPRTFRIFISSTFGDLQAERQALHERVFPRLRDLVQRAGARFQVIDLRWGVSQEASLDQRTMQICFAEIERCQRISPRPNILVMLGERYGWRPLPSEIPEEEFESITSQLRRSAVHQQRWELLERWYRRDDNAVPPAYWLARRDREYAAPESWQRVERELRTALLKGIAELDLPYDRRLCYEASATEQEIEQGVFAVPDAREHVLCFFRNIQCPPQDALAGLFTDLDPSGQPDTVAHRRLLELKERLRHTLPHTVFEYHAAWSEGGPVQDYLDQFCRDAFERLSAMIRQELLTRSRLNPLVQEVDAHAAFALDRAPLGAFRGRSDAVDVVVQYIAGHQKAPFVLYGPSGAGKSALMAYVAARLRQDRPELEVFTRFVGATPSSSNVRTLLWNLAQDISSRYGLDQATIPSTFDSLVTDLWTRLGSLPADRPAVLFLDALDQLDEQNDQSSLDWLPNELPPQVRVVVSTGPGDVLDVLLGRALPPGQFYGLQPMSQEDGATLLNDWLRGAGRTLQPAQRELVLQRFAAVGLPLYLKLAYEEARRWMSDVQPSETQLAHDAAGILRQLLLRLSSPAEHGPLLVARALAYLVCSRHGLTEDEVLALLSADPDVMDEFRRLSPLSPRIEGLAPIVWLRLQQDLAPYLTERSAEGALLISFFHRQLHEVVVENYVAAEAARHHVHLATFFTLQPFEPAPGVHNLRALSEVPYQQALAGWGSELHKTLSSFAFVNGKLLAFGLQSLLEDYVLDGPSIGTASIRDALSTAAHILDARPGELASQLHARLLDTPAPEVQLLLTGAQHSAAAPWLHPLTASLTEPAGALVRAIEVGGRVVHALALTPDGSSALVATDDGAITLWDIRRGKRVRTLCRQGMFATAVAIAPDGRRAVSGRRVEFGKEGHALTVWDLERGLAIRTFPAHHHDLGAIAILPDGRRAVSCSYDQTVCMWDLDTGTQLARFEGHAWYIRDLAVTPDGRCAVSASDDGTLKVWDLERAVLLRTLQGHQNQVLGVTVSPDGRQVVSISSDSTMRLWDLETGTQIWAVPAFGYSPRVTPDGRWIVAITGGRVHIGVWDAASGEQLAVSEGRAYVGSSLALSPDGREAVAGGGPELTIWRLDRIVTASTREQTNIAAVAIVDLVGTPTMLAAGRTGIQARSLGSGAEIFRCAQPIGLCLAVLPDGQRFLTGSLDGTIHLLDGSSGALLKTFAGNPDAVQAIALTPDGRLAVSAAGLLLTVWDLERGTRVRVLRGHASSVKSVVITPDGTRAVSLSDRGAYAGDRNLKVWDLRSGRELLAEGRVAAFVKRRFFHRDMRSSSSNPYEVRPLAVAPDESWAVSALFGDGLKLWDLTTRRPPRILHDDTQEEAVAVLPDGRILVPDGYSGPLLQLWDARQGTVIGHLEGHTGSVITLAVSSDGRRAVSAANDLTVRVWDLATLRWLAVFTIEDFAHVCAISSDGRAIAVGTEDRVHLLRLEST